MRSSSDDERIVVVMDAQTRELARAVAEIVAKGVDGHLQQFKADIESRLQIHFEDTKGVVVLAAQGYGATVESINRRLDRLEKKFDRNYRLHAAVLKDHGERIEALEKRD